MANETNGKKKLPKHLLYSLFNPTGGKGLSKADIKKPRDLKGFFTFFTHNFNMMFALNIFAIVGNFPVLFGLFALTGNLNINLSAPSSCMFPVLHGTELISGITPVSLALGGVHGLQTAVSTPTTATSVFAWLTLLMVLTFGIVNVATVYVMRNTVKGEPTSFISDIVHAVKRNFKEGMIFGVIDFVLIALIAYDLLIFYIGSAYSTLYSVFFGVMVVVALMYVMMRYYIYIMLITFELTPKKIIKNAIIFTMLGIKRNFVAILGMALAIGIEYYLSLVLIPVAIILPMLILISFVNFAGVYAAYPVIKKYMIDPYYMSDDVNAKPRTEENEAEEKAEEEARPDPIFTDRG